MQIVVDAATFGDLRFQASERQGKVFGPLIDASLQRRLALALRGKLRPLLRADHGGKAEHDSSQ